VYTKVGFVYSLRDTIIYFWLRVQTFSCRSTYLSALVRFCEWRKDW